MKLYNDTYFDLKGIVKLKTVIIGATGYGGVELIRLLQNHPHFEIGGLISSTKAGESIQDLYPHLAHCSYSLRELTLDTICELGECVFFATPAGISSQWAPLLVERGKVVIDLSGDFRLATEQIYQAWYGKDAAPQRWLDQAVYGLSEWFTAQIQSANLIANPGCYPTAALLALAPVLQAGWIRTESLIIDAKSGVTGAGRTAQQAMSFSEVNDNLRPYKVDGHQHIPEIERYATELAKHEVKVNFIPHLVPMNRGILVTIYADLEDQYTNQDLYELYRETYESKPFVRIVGQRWPQTKQVQGSNFCDIGFHVDQRTGRLILLSVIDNLVKGAAGQAIQNANIRMGFAEEAGLTDSPLFP